MIANYLNGRAYAKRDMTIAQKVDEYIAKHGDCRMEYGQDPAYGTVFKLIVPIGGREVTISWVNVP